MISPVDGDVAAALGALPPDGDADVLMGIGGTPQGVMTACAARYKVDDFVAGESLFGVTGGVLLRGPWHRDGQVGTESVVIVAVRRIVRAHPQEGLSQ